MIKVIKVYIIGLDDWLGTVPLALLPTTTIDEEHDDSSEDFWFSARVVSWADCLMSETR